MNKTLIQISSGKRAVYRDVPSQKPLLICIHGGLGLSSDSLMPGLSVLRDEFDLMFVDQRGCGDSESAGSYSLEDFSFDIQEVVEVLGLRGSKIGIFGHSMGGMIAIKCLGMQPGLFDFAILSNTSMDDSWMHASRESVKQLDQQTLALAAKQFEENPESNQALHDLSVEYGPIYFPELKTDEARAQMCKFSNRTDAISFMSEHVYPDMNLAQDVSRIEIPVLVISGDKDVVVPPTCQSAISTSLQQSSYVNLLNAGHFPFVTQPDEFRKSVLSWWNQVSRGKQ
jgi:proline iminopeptidase